MDEGGIWWLLPASLHFPPACRSLSQPISHTRLLHLLGAPLPPAGLAEPRRLAAQRGGQLQHAGHWRRVGWGASASASGSGGQAGVHASRSRSRGPTHPTPAPLLARPFYKTKPPTFIVLGPQGRQHGLIRGVGNRGLVRLKDGRRCGRAHALAQAWQGQRGTCAVGSSSWQRCRRPAAGTSRPAPQRAGHRA